MSSDTPASEMTPAPAAAVVQIPSAETASAVPAVSLRATQERARAVLVDYPRWPAYVLAVTAILILMKFGQPFLVPVIVAVLLFYALVLPVDALERLRIPRAVGAAVVVLALIAATSLTMYAVWSQLDRIADAVPRAVAELKVRWGRMKTDHDSTLSKIQGSAAAVQRAISEELPAAVPASAQPGAQPTAQTVAAKGRATPAAPAVPLSSSGTVERVFWSGTVTALELLSTLAATYLLAYFLLVDGDHFRRRWVSFVGTALSTKRVTVQALDAIDVSIRRYLAMLVVTNTALGILTFFVLRIVGVDDAAGWGVLAALLHVIPYFGPILVAGGVFVTALHQLGDLQSALYAALSTVVVSIVIGTFVQTWMTARVVRMNASVVFVSILLFGSMWGGVGLLLAVPIAVIIKVVFGAVPSLNPIARLLGNGQSEK